MTRLVFWIVVLILPVLPLVFAEVYLRSIGRGDPVLYYFDSAYRYAPRPNQRHIGDRGVAITLDSKGLRGVKDWTLPADGKILFTGASITWGGTYIDDKDLYSNVVCMDLDKALKRDFTCGNAGVNAYGIDNMAERIRYNDFADASAIVVSVYSYSAVIGRIDLDSLPFFSAPPPGPFKALWAGTTYGTWKLLRILRPEQNGASEDGMRVAERSLDNLFAALRETDRTGRKVLIVLLARREELNGHESELTKRVRTILERSGLDFLDLHQPFSAAAHAETFYRFEGSHLSRAGHQFVGDRIAERLKDLMEHPSK